MRLIGSGCVRYAFKSCPILSKLFQDLTRGGWRLEVIGHWIGDSKQRSTQIPNQSRERSRTITINIPILLHKATMMLHNTALRTATRRIISSSASRRSASSASAAFKKQGEEARRATLPLLAVAALSGCAAVTVSRQHEVSGWYKLLC